MKLNTTLKISLMVVIEIIFCFTPLGSIPIGPIVATLCMVPVVIVSLVFGKRAGAMMGLVFATCSFVYWTYILPAYPTAFLFTPFAESLGYKGNVGSLITCFVPRILAGLAPAMFIDVTSHVKANNYLLDTIATFIGSMTNTILVLFFIFLFFANEYSIIEGKNIFTILGATILTNGIPEAIICAIVCPPVVKVLRKFK